MATTYSFEASLNRSTATLTRREILAMVEAVQGAEEVGHLLSLPAGAVDVAINLGGLTKVKALFINAKPEGGVDNKDLILTIQNQAAVGVAAGDQEVRFGSYVIILDTAIISAALSNLGLTDCDVQVIALGE
jgi:hypothetical protein